MANSITSERVPGTPALRMSNGLTSVFFDVLALVAVRHGRTVWERQWAYWLVEHDQIRTGSGCVGFDVSELGWAVESFDAQKRFVLQVIDAACSREEWDLLPFSPSEEHLLPSLRTFQEMIDRFPREAIELGAGDEEDWLPGDLPTYGSCEVHRVFLHEAGCILCNDAPIGTPSARAPHRTRAP